MQITKKRAVAFLSPVIAGVLIAAVVISQFNAATIPHATLIAFGAGTPDALGNYIFAIGFMQNTTGSWVAVATLTSGSYVPGYTLTIPSNQPTRVWCMVALNLTLAGSLPEAATRARVYLTIAGVVSSFSMLYSGGYVGSAYFLSYSYPSVDGSSVWTPATDTTYACTFQYQAYY